MGMGVVCGAMLQCVFGMAPSTLSVLPQNRTLCEGLPAATILDSKPMVNVMPFGMCCCPANPVVAAATAAALGVLTPMPCIPVLPAPWAPGNPTVLIGGTPALTQQSKLMCAYGGLISIQAPGQAGVQY